MLRDFQRAAKADVYAAWAEGARNVMMVMPTGAGKTVIQGSILQELGRPACVMAHRQELVGQLALALNRENVPHGIIAPDAIIRQIICLERDMHGYSRYHPRAPVRVAGVDTLLNFDIHDRWLQQVEYCFIDEGHHVLKDNKWGRSARLFPNARGLYSTAHAFRADGAGLGAHADGLTDRLVVGPCGRELIRRGFLTDYRIMCPESDIDVSEVPISATGDYSMPKLRAATHKSKTLVGDIVKHYLDYAAGKLGITFAVDVESAAEIARKYQNAGVRAEVITGKTPIAVRGQLLRQFRERRILQLVSVDVLGEGTDVPAIEVVSMGRLTNSFQLYAQQFGRVLRIMVDDAANREWDTYGDAQRLAKIAGSVKPKALVFDHVGNFARHYQYHGMPDSRQEYTLNRRERGPRKKNLDVIPMRTCLACFFPYERVLAECPNCGHSPVVMSRATVEDVDGNLFELDPEVLRLLHGEINRVDSAPHIPKHVTGIVGQAIKNNFLIRQRAQATLREAIALYAGYQRHLGRDDVETLKRFFFRFGIDVMSAQALNAADAGALEIRIRDLLALENVVAA